MSIIRIHKTGNYSVISNTPLNDERLSWEARGVLAYLLSKPDNWTVNVRDLEKRGPARTDKMQRILAELRAAGYLVQERKKGGDGRFVWSSELYEDPCTGNPDMGDPDTGEPLLTNTVLTSTEQTKAPVPEKPTAAPVSVALIEAANKKMDAILDQEAISAKSRANGQGWRYRHFFEYDDRAANLADALVRAFGTPTKGQCQGWLEIIQTFIETGATPDDVDAAYTEAAKWAHMPTGPGETFQGLVKGKAVARSKARPVLVAQVEEQPQAAPVTGLPSNYHEVKARLAEIRAAAIP